MERETLVNYVSNKLKDSLQLRNCFLFEKYMAPGSIMLMYGDAMQSIHEGNS